MGLKWYAVPSVAGMMLEVGGLQFPAAPFNGWYNSIEIVRDFVEDPKYGLLQVVQSFGYSRYPLRSNKKYPLPCK